MLTRAVTGAIYVTVIVLSLSFGGVILKAVFGILTFFLLFEFVAMFKESKYSPNQIFIPILGSVIYLVGVSAAEKIRYFEFDYFIYFLFLSLTSIIWLGISELIRKSPEPFMNTALGIFGLAYILPTMIFINVFDLLGPLIYQFQFQFHLPMIIFVMIWSADTFAYLTGRGFGKHKMAEKISPNKTWEGFFGGLIFAMLTGIIYAYFLNDQPILMLAIIGAVIAIFSTLGDLFQSLIKRKLGLKNSGSILPGHGGLLDRLDSVLFVIPIVFFGMLVFMGLRLNF